MEKHWPLVCRKQAAIETVRDARTDGVSVSACAAAKRLPPPDWTPLDEEVTSVFSPTTRKLKDSALPDSWTPLCAHRLIQRDMVADLGAKHSIGSPIQIYPLYENAFRAFRGQSVAENWRESSEMYAEFAKVAEGHEFAWSFGQEAETAESIGKVTKKNRMICFPCNPTSEMPLTLLILATDRLPQIQC